jgi:hypothetical protein
MRVAAAPSLRGARAAGAEERQSAAGHDAGWLTGPGLRAVVALLAARPPGVPRQLVALGVPVEIRDPLSGQFGGDHGVHAGLLGAVGVAMA